MIVRPLDASAVRAVLALAAALRDLPETPEASAWLGGAAVAANVLELVRPLALDLGAFEEGAAEAREGRCPEAPRFSSSVVLRCERALVELGRFPVPKEV